MPNKQPLSTVEVFVRQVNLEGFHEVAQTAMQAAFGRFIHTEPSKEDSLKRQQDFDAHFPFRKAFPEISFRVATSFRRFAGDSTLSRGRYWSIALDLHGQDGGTLLHELLAYYEPRQAGWVTVFDMVNPEHRRVIVGRTMRAGLSKAELRRLSLGGPALVIAFLPFAGKQHQFSAKYTDKVAPFLVTIPTTVRRRRVRDVVDLRRPEAAAWFTKELTRWRIDRDGKVLDLIPAKPPLRKFRDLIPTLLEQSVGGSASVFPDMVGLRLRQLGAQGLVYPSARMDCGVTVREGRVLDATGWNFLDYREADARGLSGIVDESSHWTPHVCLTVFDDANTPQHMVYGDVSIEYRDRGAGRASWSVSGLAAWQEAWFRARSTLSVLSARDAEFAVNGPAINSLWHRAKSSLWLLQTSDVVFGALQGRKEELDIVREWADNFEGAGQAATAAALYGIANAGRR
jgi:hypothetical protein